MLCIKTVLMSCCCLCHCLFHAGASLSSPDLSSATEGAQDAADSAASDIKGAASDLKAKAKEALSGLSALPKSLATVADQNADVRGLAQNYRDPAGAIQQDKATGGLVQAFARTGADVATVQALRCAAIYLWVGS